MYVLLTILTHRTKKVNYNLVPPNPIHGIKASSTLGIDRVAVFGSRATGRYRPNSDLDLVLYGSADAADCDRLWTLFQESSLPFSVDVVSYAAIDSPPLRAHIDAVARPLFVRTENGLAPVDARQTP